MLTEAQNYYRELLLKENISEDRLDEAFNSGTNSIMEVSKYLLRKKFITREKVTTVLAEVRKKYGTRSLTEVPIQTDEKAEEEKLEQARRKLHTIVLKAKEMGASDVHLHVSIPPFLRIHGQLRETTLPPLKPEDTELMALAICPKDQRDRFLRTKDLDLSYEIPGRGRFRTNLFKDRRGFGIVMRIINDRVPAFAELNLPPQILRLIEFHHGLVLVTGPVGCGKTTTLAALINEINIRRRDHIVTIEDPIEYVHESKGCQISQREAGRHTRSFAVALRAALREDPDVILVGEMRDLETMQIAITAAETGHLVLATLHTSGAARTINRMIDVFPPEQQEHIRTMVAESLRGIVTQQLLPTKDGKGRVVATEILFVTPAVSNLIQENQTFKIRGYMETGRSKGMRLLDESLAELVLQGKVDETLAASYLDEPRFFYELIERERQPKKR